MTPLIIGRYALYGEIASGGMATVHYGRLVGPVGFSRTVAIKRLHPQFAKDPEFAAMFLDEARLAARIRHPNVVPTLDVVSIESELFLVLDYVQGESLSRLVRACTTRGEDAPLDVVSAIVCGALHGLHAAHEATSEDGAPLGIVHRDVSPQNILVGADGVPRALDFGVAKAAGRAQTTRDGELKGKLAYMSPEQMLSEGVDRRTDVYAVGVVLWETLTRERLFVGDTDPATIRNVLEGASKAPSSIAPHIPASIDAVALRALERDPKDRFQSARQMALALEAAMPLASPTRVADWMQGLVGDVLAERARAVAEIESHSGVARAGPPAATATDEATKTDRSRPGSVVEVRGGAPPSGQSIPSSHTAKYPLARIGALALLVVAVAVFSTLRLRSGDTHAGPPPTLASAGTSVSARATTLLDLPAPATTVAAAAQEYAAGMQMLHDNNWNAARVHFERASRLDPLMAIAHLRYAMTAASETRETSRSEFMRAADLRGRLTPRDLGLMEALEPVVLRSHGDPVLATTRLEALSKRYPTDVEILDLLGVVRPDSTQALETSDRAIALDPTDGQAWQTKGKALWMSGRFDEASGAFERCSQLSVGSADCLWSSAAVDKMRGRCDQFEKDARAYRDRDPADGWSLLAASMVALHRPRSAVSETIEEGIARLDASARVRETLAFNGKLALVEGDFDAVTHAGAAESALVASDPTARAEFSPHYALALEMVSAALETGDAKGVRGIAGDFVARSASWSDDPVPAHGDDLTVYLTRLSAPEGGAEFEARRHAWIDARVAEGHPRGTLWVPAFAAPALNREEAQAALDALPEYAPLAHSFDHASIQDAVVGHTYALAGKPLEALPFLRRAVANCNMLFAPLAHVRAAFDLGSALEATGDRPAACEAYAEAIARWGHAKPRSITADRARERAKQLACGK